MSANPKAFNAGDEDHVAARAQTAKERDAARRSGLRKIMTDPECRAWMYDLLEACGVFRTSFTGNSETFFREGSRNVGLKVMGEIHKDHDQLYVQMCREALARGARGFATKAMKDLPPKEDQSDD